jgi:hypothetical protein
MPLSTDVSLPKILTPVFPDRCVACGLPSLGSSIRVTTNAIGWWTIAFWVHGARFSVDVPSCEPCRRQMIRQKWLRRTVGGLFVVIGLCVAMSTLGSIRGPFNRWLAMGIALLCMIPYFAWEILLPRPIDLTAYSDTVDYEFRDEEYAMEFASLNQQTIEDVSQDLARPEETVG